VFIEQLAMAVLLALSLSFGCVPVEEITARYGQTRHCVSADRKLADGWISNQI